MRVATRRSRSGSAEARRRWPDDDLEAAPRVEHREGLGRLVERIAVADQRRPGRSAPDPASSIARVRSSAAIRRLSWMVSSLRRAAPAGKRGPITVGDADQHDPAAAAGPPRSRRQRVVVARDLEGDVDRRRRGPLGGRRSRRVGRPRRRRSPRSRPCARAAATRWASRSVATMTDAPAWRRSWIRSRPSGPQP